VVAFPLRRVGAKNRCTPVFRSAVSRARYFNPNTGRFWTMDTNEGSQEDPFSLHKYLYCEDEPIGHTDPSGHDGLDSMTDISAVALGRNGPFGVSDLRGAYATPSTAWGASRSLTPSETDVARTIYGGNIDYSKTGVDYGKWTFWQPKGREMTPDGIIHTGGQTITDYTVPGAKPNWQYGLVKQEGVLIHELCHVWQYQQYPHKDKKLYMELSGLYRKYDYSGPNFGNLPFSDYGIEQQAAMTEDYFDMLHGEEPWTVKAGPLKTYEKVIPFLPSK
jgi:hypothetical protein